jgi:hypothetical protein
MLLTVLTAPSLPLSPGELYGALFFEFYTLGRFSDIIALRRNSLRFCSKPAPHLLVSFTPGAGKTDKKMEGSERVVSSNPERQYCPVRWLMICLFQSVLWAF